MSKYPIPIVLSDDDAIMLGIAYAVKIKTEKKFIKRQVLKNRLTAIILHNSQIFMTVSDRVKAMSDEERAAFLSSVSVPEYLKNEVCFQ